MQNFKDEYKRQFVDINFYGMQTRTSNPMYSPDWKGAVRKKETEQYFNKSLERLEEEKAALKRERYDAMLPPGKHELSPAERLERKNALVGRFKATVDGLRGGGAEEERHDSPRSASRPRGKYHDMLSQSFRPRNTFSLSTKGSLIKVRGAGESTQPAADDPAFADF